MAQKEALRDKMPGSMMPDPAELAKATEKQVAAIAEMQTKAFDALREINKRWLDRAAVEAKLATDLGTKLSATRSVPEAIQAYQQWMTERTKSLVEDSQQFMTDCQRLTEEMMRAFPKGWSGGST